MPAGIHKKRARTYRPDPVVYEKAKAAVAEVDSDMNAYINAFLLWLVHEADELPARPPKLPAG